MTIKNIHGKLVIVAHAYKPSTQKVEAGDQEFKASLAYVVVGYPGLYSKTYPKNKTDKPKLKMGLGT